MPVNYNEKHFYTDKCKRMILTDKFDFPEGADLEQKLAEAALASKILGQDKINDLVEKGIIEPCMVEARIGKGVFIKSGYLFSNGEADADYNKILEERSLAYDFSEID